MSAGGRVRWADWALTGVGIAVAGTFLGATLSAGIHRGSHVAFSITLIRQDAENLACKSAESFGGSRCERGADGKVENVASPIRPVSTTEKQVILLAGVFEESHVAAWLAEARLEQNDDRVTVYCRGEVLGQAGAAGVRWRVNAPFIDERDVYVARADDCDIAR